MLINTYLDTEDFVHLYYPEDESPPAAQGCGAGARMHSKYAQRPPSPHYEQIHSESGGDEMSERAGPRAPPPPEPPPHRVRAADLYPRVRTHFDEPGLDVGFSPICGEFVQWVGRTADGGTLAMSNYRFHVQPRRRNGFGTSVPLRLIDSVEVRDLVHLLVLCKDGKTLKCTFLSGDLSGEWLRRLSGALTTMLSLQYTFAAAYAAWAREQPPSSVHRALMRSSHQPHKSWFGPELERLGFTARNAWRVTAVNADFKLCPSYPPLLIVPASIGDKDLDSVARFRAMRRVPAVVWRHRGNGAVIARSSQPEVGWLGWRNDEDELLLAAFVSACANDRGLQPPTINQHKTKLLIIDARSYASAVTNRARGGGCECQQYYPAADIQFMCLPNIHHVRKSFQQLRQYVAEPADQANWHGNLERSLWLQYISGLGRAAGMVARAVLGGRPVLVHCSDGWDRTPQITATAQLLLDPYYRTIEGFRVLIEREWLDFGHKFADRCGHQFASDDPNERSPIFLQWLDLVHQCMLQYPCSFEFSHAYLIKLLTHVHSCMFGTFLCNNARERAEARVGETTAQVWRLLEGPAYRNHLYAANSQEQVLWADFSVRSLQFWREVFAGARHEGDEDDAIPRLSQSLLHAPQHAPGPMTKTRSYDDLLSEGEKKATQRRSSDPNIAVDVMKMSHILASSDSGSSLSRGGMTPALDQPGPSHSEDQVDNLHPNHFEHGDKSPSPLPPRDLASNSSSLERELTTPVAPSPSADPRRGSCEDAPKELLDEDVYSDVREAARAAAAARNRNWSITWRSEDSEGSQQTDSSAGEDRLSDLLHNIDNHNSTEGDALNHNNIEIDSTLAMSSTLTNHNRLELNGDATSSINGVIPTNGDIATNGEAPPNGEIATNGEVSTNGLVVTNGSLVSNGDVTRNGDLPNGDGLNDVATKLLQAELAGATSSSVSSESEGEGYSSRVRRRTAYQRLRVASQQTLCPGSPRANPRPACRSCCHCCRRASVTSGIETSGDSLAGSEQCCNTRTHAESSVSALCVCGGSSRDSVARDPLDGLQPSAEPLQARLHQIIMHQRMEVEELTLQLRAARAALQRASSPQRAHPPPAPPAPQHNQMTSSISNSCSNSSGSGSEVEVGEEARNILWLPDSAAPRCQSCSNHFWLARRRHHCRKCGGIFCSSCSHISSVGEWASVRLCRRCSNNR